MTMRITTPTSRASPPRRCPRLNALVVMNPGRPRAEAPPDERARGETSVRWTQHPVHGGHD